MAGMGVDIVGGADPRGGISTGMTDHRPNASGDEPTPAPCCFDEWTADYAKRVRGGDGFGRPVTRALFEAIAQTGLSGRSVLDIGCGVGDFALQAVARGADRAVGYDLSTTMIEEGTRLAAERGLAARVRLHVGDGAAVELPPSDVVVLNRVFCCYPDVTRLLENSLGAARSVYAFTIPPSRGIRGLLARVSARLENIWYALRPKKYGGFRVFVHDVDAIDRRVRSDGFRPMTRGMRGLSWHLAVYAR
jgi:SAM-dependent methyltransferase